MRAKASVRSWSSDLTLFIDADACPVKDEAIKVAERHRTEVKLVCDGGLRRPQSPWAELVIVPEGADAADDWIAEHISPGDIAITNDIPLADRCLKQGAGAIRADGKTFTENSIGMAMATREIMATLRDRGEMTGGPPPFSKQDRSRFLQALETAVQAQRNV